MNRLPRARRLRLTPFLLHALSADVYLPGADGSKAPGLVVGVGLIILTIFNFLLLIEISLYKSHEAPQFIHQGVGKDGLDNA